MGAGDVRSVSRHPMATPTTQHDPAMGGPAARPRIPWHVVYFLLAAFDVLTVSASLYLSFQILEIYRRSVAQNQEWAGHLDEYAGLQRLAGAVNAPGNDVFESEDVPRESERMARAEVAFAERVTILRRHLKEAHPDEAGRLLARIDAVEQAMDEMTAEARSIFAEFAAGGAAPAGPRMAAMDRRYARALTSLEELR